MRVAGSASTDGHLRALDAAGGAVRWQLEVGLVDGSSPAVSQMDGTIYIGVRSLCLRLRLRLRLHPRRLSPGCLVPWLHRHA